MENYGFNSPKWRYNTHKQQRVTIHYFLHPLYTKDIEIIKELNFTTEKVYVFKFFDNTETHLPAWMSDADYCGRCVIQDKPESSLFALLELRKFLDCVDL